MGAVTLAQFRSDIEIASGRRVTIADDVDLIDRAVNYAYQELVGAIDFAELKGVQTVDTIDGQAYVSVPSVIRSIIAVINASTQTPLEETSEADYFFNDRSLTDEPEKWVRMGDRLYIYPTPDLAYTLEIPARLDPQDLVTVTAISNIWDQAIFYIALCNIFLWIGEEQRGALWLNRSIAYLQTRITPEELQRFTAGRGLAQADALKLTSQMIGAQNG